MIIYSKRDTFLQRLHPLTGVLLIISYLMAAILLKNPIYLAVILFSIITSAYIDGCLVDVFSYIKFVAPIAVLIIVFNPLVSHNGVTILHKGQMNLPVFGTMTITLEALLYGIYMSIIMTIVTIIFGFGNMVLHPDRTFGYFAKYLKKSSLLMSMTIKLFPSLMNSYKNIVEIEKLRGNSLYNKNFFEKIKGQGNVVNILFMSSLEDSVDVAESMYSRGFGIGKRSTYFREKIRVFDLIVIFIVIIQIVGLICFNNSGLNNMGFYPRCDNPLSILSVYGMMLCLVFFMPSIINLGWNIWRR